jgi:hypothetical protein
MLQQRILPLLTRPQPRLGADVDKDLGGQLGSHLGQPLHQRHRVDDEIAEFTVLMPRPGPMSGLHSCATSQIGLVMEPVFEEYLGSVTLIPSM